MARHGLSLIEIQSKFATEEQCLEYLEAARWPMGVTCLKCGGSKISKIITNETTREVKNRKGVVSEKRVPARRLYQCNTETVTEDGEVVRCRHQFSATAGTIFADTHLPLNKWFLAIGLMADAKKGLSAKQLERHIGVNYRTAWHLNHRIREAMQDGAPGLFGGTVEVDATFVGGRYDKRRKRAPYDKQAVAGVIQRATDDTHSKVKAFPVAREIKPVMMGFIQETVDADAHIMTDEHPTYKGLTKDGRWHEIVRHTTNEWVRGDVHTNGIESFWSLFKRGVIGSFHQVSVKHLHRYLNEFSYRFNNRESRELFAMVVINLIAGNALRYDALTGRASASLPSAPSA